MIRIRLINFVLIALSASAAAKDKDKVDKKRDPATTPREQASTYFQGLVSVDYDSGSPGGWPALYRIYDPKHKVVCYYSGSAAISCAPSAAQ